MNISIKELREYLVPKLCALKLANKHKDCVTCNIVRNDIQVWLDDLYKKEQEKP